MARQTQKQTELRYLAHRMAAPVCERGGASLVRDELDAQCNDDVSQAQAERDALAAITALPRREQSYLAIADYWSRRGPRAERDDWRGELYVRLVEAGQGNVKLAWNACKCDCIKLWKRYVRQNEFSVAFSAPGPDASDTYVDRTMGDIAAESCYVSDVAEYVCDKLDHEALWARLNANPRLAGIVSKRLRGEALRGADRVYLHRWLSEHRGELVAA